MLEALLDSPVKEKLLLSVLSKKEVYARDIAHLFGLHLLSVQNQLKKLERGGVLVSRTRGRTKLYSFNPRYTFISELTGLLDRVMYFIPQNEKQKYYEIRQRPRRSGKPL